MPPRAEQFLADHPDTQGRLMGCSPEDGLHLNLDRRAQDSDLLDQLPGEGFQDQKLGLFALLHERIPEVRRCDGGPVDLVEVAEVGVEVGVVRARIAGAEDSASHPTHCRDAL
ncbi:MAG TPA: hypothetical protein VGM86_19000 [Thermoanaerobaculia bacterium]